MRVVLDTNVYVSALLNPAGAPGRVVRQLILGDLEVCASARIWGEVVRVVQRPKIQRALERRGGAAAARRILDDVFALVRFVDLEPPAEAWLAGDPDDDWVIQCALTAGAACIVTGDALLLGLGSVQGVEVLDAPALLARLAHAEE